MTEANDDSLTLIGALLWLRNHYDVGDPALKGEVLKHIDKLLDQHSEKFALSRREWSKKLHAKDSQS